MSEREAKLEQKLHDAEKAIDKALLLANSVSDKTAQLIANIIVRVEELERIQDIQVGKRIILHSIWACVVFITPIIVTLMVKFIK